MEWVVMVVERELNRWAGGPRMYNMRGSLGENGRAVLIP